MTILKNLFGFFFLMGMVSFSYSQDKVKPFEDQQYLLNKEITLSSDSKRERIPINIRSNTHQLNIQILGSLKEGEIKVLILDPNGKTEGKFNLKSNLDNRVGRSSGKAEGNFQKGISNPLKGEWIIEIEAAAATGTVEVSIGKPDKK